MTISVHKKLIEVDQKTVYPVNYCFGLSLKYMSLLGTLREWCYHFCSKITNVIVIAIAPTKVKVFSGWIETPLRNLMLVNKELKG